jgi:hypothetical protein
VKLFKELKNRLFFARRRAIFERCMREAEMEVLSSRKNPLKLGQVFNSKVEKALKEKEKKS